MTSSQENQLTQFFSKNFEKACVSPVDIWKKLKNARIFITGGTGFFGCWLLRLVEWANREKYAGIQVHILTRDWEAFLKKRPEFARSSFITVSEGDIRTFEFPQGQWTHVIHAATEASAKLNQENPLLMLDTITEGTRRALDFAVQCRAERFLLTSSGAVYGRQPSLMTHVSEEYFGAPDPLQPGSAYGEGKRLAEQLCAIYSHTHSLKTLVGRCFAFVGPYLPLDTHFAVGNFIRDAIAHDSIQIGGDGTPYRSYLYGADLAYWLFVVLAEGQAGRAYNIGSEDSYSIQETAETVKNAAQLFDGKQIQVHIAKRPRPGQPAERYVPQISRIKNELGVNPTFTLAEGIQETLLWNRLSSRG